MDNQITTFVGNASTLSELILQQPDLSFLNKPTITSYAAGKYGKKFAEGVRPSLKALKALGVTDEQIKAARKEHDVVIHNYYKNVRAVTALLTADEDYRQTVKASYDAKGNARFDVQFRKMSEESTVKWLTRKLHEAEAKLKAKDPVANALPAKASVVKA